MKGQPGWGGDRGGGSWYQKSRCELHPFSGHTQGRGPHPCQTLPSAAPGRQEDAVSVHLHGSPASGLSGCPLPHHGQSICSIGATKQKQLECPLARITLWEGSEAPGRKHHGLSIWPCLRPHWKELKQRGLGGRVGRGEEERKGEKGEK